MEDVSSHKSFDLLGRNPDGVEVHIEVKGTTSAGRTVSLTKGEADHARRFPEVDLFVVHDIELTHDKDGKPVLVAGS